MRHEETSRKALAEQEGRDYREYGDARGKVRLWHLSNRIGIFESTGGLKEDHADFIIAFHGDFIETNARPYYSFGNWLELKAYTPEVRRKLTNWQIEMKYEGLFVAQHSRLLAMSVAIANAVLSNEVKTYGTLDELERVLSEVRTSHGV